MYLSTPVFSHGQYYVGRSRAGSFQAVKVLVVDHEKQGLYENNEGMPDGVYTDNVVWTEALLQRECVETFSSPPLASDMTSQAVSTDNREETRPTTQTVADTSQTEPMTEYIDEGSGALATPRTKRAVQQPLYKHGTYDTYEYGAAPAHASTSNVTMVGTEKDQCLIWTKEKKWSHPMKMHQVVQESPRLRTWSSVWTN